MEQELYIVMPVYNAARFLHKSIASVLRQTFHSFHFIIVDDGSTDGSGKICDEYAAKDSRIRVIHQLNQGSFLARKNGLAQCPDQSYVLFLDADDIFLKNTLQIFRNALEKSRADVCIANLHRMSRGMILPTQQTITEELHIDQNEFFEKYFCSWYGITLLPVNLCGKAFKADLLKQAYAEIPENTTRFFGDDLLVSLHYIVKCTNIHCIPDAVYAYRMGGGTTKYRPTMLQEFLSLYSYKLQFAKSYSTPQDLRLLSDIELCYVAFCYWKTLYYASGLTQDDRLREVQKTMCIPQLRDAAQNVTSSDFQDKKIAEWIVKQDCDAALSASAPTKKDKIKQIIQKLS